MWTKNKATHFAAAGVFVSTLLGLLFVWETSLGSIRLVDGAAVAWLLVASPWILSQVKMYAKEVTTFSLVLAWLVIVCLLVGAPVIALLSILRWMVFLLTAWSLQLWVRAHSHTWSSWLDLWGLAWVALGVGQYLFWPDTRGLYWLGWDDHLFRAFGSVFDPLFYGLVSSVVAWRGARRFSQGDFVSVLLLSFGSIGVALSFSRLAMLSMAGWIVLEFIKNKRWNSLVVAASILILSVVLVPKDGGGEGQMLLRTSSVTARESALEQDIATWNWLGHGWYLRSLEESPLPSNATTSDSAWIQLWLSGGVGVLLITLLGALWLKPRSPVLWWYFLGSAASLVSLSAWVLIASAILPEEK